ncbi:MULTISPECIES: MMPL family transporter [Streptomyces]|uniref:MMPL family transporter n=1 Tax=Streptomyces TaxID=1883 RepID=UPI00163C17C7|nr:MULTISPECIES: MMPL family transporter [Streptomyces]MBC2875495.1 MMPL family transporter [Streptomyces sp. TYQ1024]UBI35734.1 MMPL family transporter [Streptomyces mobaraensis]UKW28327.1 MMPL family transporter [Streptomyces sp. TYQ1024]
MRSEAKAGRRSSRPHRNTAPPAPPSSRARPRLLLWLVVAGWLLLAGLLSPFQGKLQSVTSNNAAAFLPGSAPSAEVSRFLKDRFPDGDTRPALVVQRRPGGLTAADRGAVVAEAARLRTVPGTQPPVAPFTADGRPVPGLVSADGSVAVTVVPVTATGGKKVRETVDALRDALHPPSGVTTDVTGPAGISADAIAIFSDVDFRLLAATAVLVLVLLLIVYRSPLLAFVPLVVVSFAYVLAAGVVYALAAHAGLLINSQATSLMLILMFGAGTDYCLLMTARYQEELTADPSAPWPALRRAVRRVWPTVFFSGLTVMASLSALFAADLGSTRVLGPVGIIGTASVLLSTFTLMPALLALIGPRALLRRAARTAAERPRNAGAVGRAWERTARAVFRRPWWATAATLLFFAAGATGLTRSVDDMSLLHAFREPTSSADGYRTLSDAFPAGTAAPLTVVVERADGPLSGADLAGAAARVRSVPDIASVAPQPVRSEDGRAGRLQVVLDTDPYDAKGLDRVADVRHALSSGLPSGVRAVVGGDPAVQLDTKRAADRDLRILVPLILAIIMLVLVALLRAVIAPLYLIATVVVSFFGALGISMYVFRDLLGQHGVNPVMPTFAFLFLVALGVDYNIFLMARVREDARAHDTRTAVRTALLSTGSVITSAGLVLAGTFSILMILPLVMLFQLGFTVALGVLLDTVLVRVVLVPAVTWLLGEKAWWPARRTATTVVPDPAD